MDQVKLGAKVSPMPVFSIIVVMASMMVGQAPLREQSLSGSKAGDDKPTGYFLSAEEYMILL